MCSGGGRSQAAKDAVLLTGGARPATHHGGSARYVIPRGEHLIRAAMPRLARQRRPHRAEPLSLCAVFMTALQGGTAHAYEGARRLADSTWNFSCVSIEVLDLPIASVSQAGIDCSGSGESGGNVRSPSVEASPGGSNIRRAADSFTDWSRWKHSPTPWLTARYH
ncbi:hypothetical protein GCM10010360_58600 [Streptomyces nogalater]